MTLTDSEVKYIEGILGREMNELEEGMLDVMFSEHCSYKSSRPILKLFPTEGENIVLYLAMARVAHREGYPEIGLYWEKAAYEEAEHAAKFAELLGEDLEPNMKATTKDNLAWRVDCEFGATQGKFDLAACAKKNGLDAIHDTVHEMAKDEARHGKALKGLLERYFK